MNVTSSPVSDASCRGVAGSGRNSRSTCIFTSSVEYLHEIDIYVLRSLFSNFLFIHVAGFGVVVLCLMSPVQFPDPPCAGPRTLLNTKLHDRAAPRDRGFRHSLHAPAAPRPGFPCRVSTVHTAADTSVSVLPPHREHTLQQLLPQLLQLQLL